ncbi:probable helicase with zinc finger domain [Dermacentor andersoni]|uniref:probable helicase with zinc finger domain n=1 Tax=Dermacentor andersoni TaxID=34620 RepID=UPI002155303B|nr:probable helicase with zinc finger domain [Dermacentor andersoni]
MSWADTESDFACEFCGVSFHGEKEFRDHCNSPEHRTVLVSDGGRTWKHRPPPRGVPADELSICHNHHIYGQCRLGSQCCEAHSEDELAEWQERLRYRMERVKKAQQKHLEGYQEYAKDLLERYAEAKDPTAMQRVMTETMPGLRLTCKQQLKRTVTSKETALVWEFELCTITPLQRLVLLHDAFRGHFELRRVEKSPFKFVLAPGCQEWVNSLRAPTNKDVLVYFIQVGFQSSMYATFVQTLAFDFGGYPVLIRNFSVDMVAPDMMGSIERSRRLILTGMGRWNAAAIDLVPFTERRSAKVQSLYDMYPAPDVDTFLLTQAVIGEELTRENYRARMHELLYVEEMARADIIAQYNIRVSLDVTDNLQTSSANSTEAYYAQGGELFACLRLDADITEDTAAGRLVLQNCQLVWLAPVKAIDTEERKPAKPRVHELPIQLARKDRVYIRLTKECVSEFMLKPDTSFEAEVQFLLDRQPLCEMHYAVDKLPMASLVFPDFSIRPPRCPPELSLSWDPRLNERQRQAVAAIVAPRTVPNVPPILVVGPFGTGKTFTLAKAMLEVVKKIPESRVLICTHSNSAADLYVLEHLDKEVQNHPALCPLRILYEYRMPNRVDRRLLQYCLEVPREQQSKQGPWFRQPTAEEIEAHRVVVTTLSSSQMLLASNIKRGFFTHIFIDEAAQAMETECILPLALADENTRIVLAGDYMQLNPEVFSVFTRERRLHVSLLERLHDAFQRATRGSGDTQHPCQVVLEDNYRSHEALVRFTSESFYGGRLRALGSPGPHHLLHALSFFAARGEDMPRDGSTSYVNHMEVLEVCDVVKRLVDQWPMTWGPRDPSTVAIVTPYYDQVQCIRMELRKYKLSQVRVESVANVQGKEFRAVVLSTVRTRATCVHLEQTTPFKTALNFGFLSDAKLLNTALTRAQSLVVVVGDPVSLCSIGDCRTLWEKFVSTCARQGSLFNMQWEDIKYQLEGFELQKEHGLNPHAKCFWPKHPFLDRPPVDDPRPPVQPAPTHGFKALPGLAFPPRHVPVAPPNYYVPAIDRRLFGVPPPRAPGFFPSLHSSQGSPSWWQGLPPGPRPSNQPQATRTYQQQLQQAQAQAQRQQQYPQMWSPYLPHAPGRPAQYQHFPPAQARPSGQLQQHGQPVHWSQSVPSHRLPQHLPQHLPQQQLPSQLPPRQPQMEPKMVAQPSMQLNLHSQPSTYGHNHVQKEQPHQELQQQQQCRPPLGFNSNPSLSANDMCGATGATTVAGAAGDNLGSMDTSFRNMLLDDDDGGWTCVGANKQTTNGTGPEARLPRKKKTVAPRFAAQHCPSRPASQPSSQPERPLKVLSNGVIAGGSSAARTVSQVQQLSQQTWPEVSKSNSSTQNGGTQTKHKVFRNSAWSGGQDRIAQSQEARQKARPTVAYIAAVSEPVTWGNSETQRSVGNCAASSHRTINDINFGLDLYKAFTSDDEDRPKDSTKLTDTLRAGFAQAGRQTTYTAAEQTTAGSKFGPIGSRPPDKPKLSYSDALRNGHVNGFVTPNTSKR